MTGLPASPGPAVGPAFRLEGLGSAVEGAGAPAPPPPAAGRGPGRSGGG